MDDDLGRIWLIASGSSRIRLGAVELLRRLVQLESGARDFGVDLMGLPILE